MWECDSQSLNLLGYHLDYRIKNKILGRNIKIVGMSKNHNHWKQI